MQVPPTKKGAISCCEPLYTHYNRYLEEVTCFQKSKQASNRGITFYERPLWTQDGKSLPIRPLNNMTEAGKYTDQAELCNSLATNGSKIKAEEGLVQYVQWNDFFHSFNDLEHSFEVGEANQLDNHLGHAVIDLLICKPSKSH